MIMIGLFFWIMAGVNYAIHRMHQGKADALLKEAETLTTPEAIEENKKQYQNRLGAIKSTLFSTGILVIGGFVMFLMAF